MNIHPTAVVSPQAKLGNGVVVHPFCVIEPGTTIGDGCVLEGRVVVKQGTTLGQKNHVFEGAILGGLPQHLQARAQVGSLIIGDNNTIRENVTINRALEAGHATILGSHNLLMTNVHLAHDCHVGSHTIFANNVMLAGHVTVEDRAFLSGAVGVHQFCRIGRLAMVGGQAHVSKDIAPFVTIDGASTFVVGLNQVGLRRSGLTAAEIAELKAAYRLIFRSGLKWTEILQRLPVEFPSGQAAHFHEFFLGSKRGITPERRLPRGTTIKIRDESTTGPDLERKAG